MGKEVLAHPYAKAAFDYAKEHACVPNWQAFLSHLSLFLQAPEVCDYLNRPAVASANPFNLWAIFEEIYPIYRIAEGNLAYQNFFKILIETHRLGLLPEIYEVFEELCIEEAQLISAVVTSAKSLTQAQRDQISAALKVKFSHEVNLICEEDPSLLAGLKIKVGDWVFENSLQGRFERLKETLKN